MRGYALLLASVLSAVSHSTVARADERVPTGTLRVTYIATNPVQAFFDAESGAVRGPGADVARAIAARLNLPVTITGVAGPAAVIDSIKTGAADLGLLAFDPTRTADVDFSEVYALAQNSYVVPVNSPFRSVADVDRAGVKVGVTERDTADLFLTRALKAATVVRNGTGSMATAAKWLNEGAVDAYGTNRARLTDLAARNPGYRLLPDNFYGVEQAVAAAKGNVELIDVANRVIAEAKASGLIAQSIAQAGLVGVDVAPAEK